VLADFLGNPAGRVGTVASPVLPAEELGVYVQALIWARELGM
jgi:hypothetical protein